MNDPAAQVSEEARSVLNFWFQEISPEQWFKGTELDEPIRTRFSDMFQMVEKETPANWLKTPEGSLAAIIVLDQFPRNIFRDTARAFATDARALSISKSAIDQGFDKELNQQEKTFLYMPFQHTENLDDQIRSLELFGSISEGGSNEFAQMHKDIIEKFGRFPHRNKALGRQSTEEEIKFLNEGSLFW